MKKSELSTILIQILNYVQIDDIHNEDGKDDPSNIWELQNNEDAWVVMHSPFLNSKSPGCQRWHVE